MINTGLQIIRVWKPRLHYKPHTHSILCEKLLGKIVDEGQVIQ